MRIALVTEYYASPGSAPVGGVDARTRWLAAHLARGHEVHVIAARLEGTDAEETEGSVQVHRVGRPRSMTQGGAYRDRLAFAGQVARVARQIRPDVVDGSGMVSYAPARSAARVADAACVATVHEVWLGQWRRNLGIPDALVGALAERRALGLDFDGFVVVSEATRRQLLAIRPDSHERVRVLPNGIDVERIEALAGTPRTPEPTLLAVSRLVEYKRLDLAVRALAQPGLEDARLQIVGEGPAEPALRELARREGVEERVEFLGKISIWDDLIRLMAGSHALVHPSTVEGFGMVVAEAMAVGLPYVAADIPALREVTGDGLGGRLVSPASLEALCSGLRDVLERPETADERSRAHVRRRYDWRSIARGHADYYRTLAEARKVAS